MNTSDVIRQLCRDNNISVTELEQELGFSNGSLLKNNSIRSDRLYKVAKKFNVSMEYLTTGEQEEKETSEGNKYYFDDNTAAIAQDIYDNPRLRALMDAARDCDPEDLKMAADMLLKFKRTNPNG
jgi:transcriptional regulator with XRE-family HTH domain